MAVWLTQRTTKCLGRFMGHYSRTFWKRVCLNKSNVLNILLNYLGKLIAWWQKMSKVMEKNATNDAENNQILTIPQIISIDSFYLGILLPVPVFCQNIKTMFDVDHSDAEVMQRLYHALHNVSLIQSSPSVSCCPRPDTTYTLISFVEDVGLWNVIIIHYDESPPTEAES